MSKTWWKSKTVWAAIASFILNVYHVALPVALQFGVMLPDVPPMLVMMLNIFFGGLIVYGRSTATGGLTLTNKTGDSK